MRSCLQGSRAHPLKTDDYFVGYQNTAARAGFNFYAPPFRGINAQVDPQTGLKLMDMQEIQMDDSVAATMANLQRRDKTGKSTEYYTWFDKATAQMIGYTDGSKGVWVNENGTQIDPPIMLSEGDCVQVDVGISTVAKILNNGEVSDGDITYPTRAGFNFIGNSYPAGLDIQMILVDDSVAATMANLQRRDKTGKSTEYYTWFDKATAQMIGYTDGSKGVWVNENGTQIDPAIILEAGEGVQVDVGIKTDALITTLAPIEL